MEERHFGFVVDDASGFRKRSGFVSRLRRHFGLVEIATVVGVRLARCGLVCRCEASPKGSLVRQWLGSFLVEELKRAGEYRKD